jgi:5-methylcytosine-specific restriction enzyme subunit McrC
LRAAIQRLLGLRLKEDRWRWALRSLESRLDGVRLISYDPRRVPVVSFDRRTEHYRAAVGLARLILTGSSFDLRPGVAPASAFLIDMNRVFENFVVVALRDSLRASDKVLVQGAQGKALFLDVAQLVRLRPDISLWKGGQCLFVGDMKYKRLVPDEYPNADLYQLTAYAIATGLPSGMLIYAAGEQGETVHEVRNLGKRLLVTPVDLTAPPAGLLRQIAELASRIRLAAAA